MTNVVIDIRTKIISPSARIWRMFPGDHYEFLPEFRKQSAVFLDLPGLALPEGQIVDSTPLLRESIIKSSKTRKWIDDYRKWAKTSGTDPAPVRPEQDLEAYRRIPKNRNFGRHLGSIKTLFAEAQKGDLVVVRTKSPRVKC